MNPNPQVVSDFSNLPPYYGSTPFGSAYVLVGDRYEAAPTLSIYALQQDKLPPTFPLQAWYDQSARYLAYWSWFNGDVVHQAKQGPDGDIQFRFPLRVNPLRDIVRKNTAILFGEAPDGPTPLVTTNVRARKALTGEEPDEQARALATLCENIVNEVWMQSNGRSIQQEGGELCQFLGGTVYQVIYQAWRKDVQIPIFIRPWKADLFLPVWRQGNYWELSEAYVVTRMESAIAKKDYGFDSNGAFVFYVEHWSESKYSITIDGKPIQMIINDELVVFDNLDNPFGKVPFFYIPHLREGSYYGSSHIPDMEGLIEEYNSALANLGDAIQDSVERERYMRNASGRSKDPIILPNGRRAVNLGVENPSAKNPPEVYVEDPPQLSSGLVNYPKMIYEQIRRSGFMPAVADGEDEGSQRSGVTLDIRFWPATAHAKVERGFWETGLNLIARMILTICQEKQLFQRFKVNPKTTFLNDLAISQNWSPMIPRDRQAEVNEYLSRLGAHGMSLDMFLDKIGDVDNQEEEKNAIVDWMETQQKYSSKLQPDSTGSPLTQSPFQRQNDAIDKQP